MHRFNKILTRAFKGYLVPSWNTDYIINKDFVDKASKLDFCSFGEEATLLV